MSKKPTLKKVSHLTDRIDALKDKCRQFDQCIAFTSDGYLYKKVEKAASFRKQSRFKGEIQGLYVAGKT